MQLSGIGVVYELDYCCRDKVVIKKFEFDSVFVSLKMGLFSVLIYSFLLCTFVIAQEINESPETGKAFISF